MRPRHVALVFLATGAIGFFLGAIRHPQWQDALEPAQVLAGLVRYPPGNPVYLYSMGTWTFVHQALAMLLRLGCSEQQLAILVSGALGMVSLQALGVLVLALSEDPLLAIAVPFLAYWSDATAPYFLMNTWTTYGVLGPMYMLLAFALIAAGRIAAGAALLGFGFAIHPAWGLWCTLALVIAIATDRRTASRWIHTLLPFFLAGLAASAVSAAGHYLSGGFSVMPRIGAPDAYLAAFKERWDAHRAPVGLRTPEMKMALAVAAFALLWVWRFAAEIPPRVALILKALVTAVVLGVGLSLSYRLPATRVSELLLALDPSRLIGLGPLTGAAIVFGLAGRDRRNPARQRLVAGLALVFCLIPLQDQIDPARAAYIATAVGAVLLLLLAFGRHPVDQNDGPLVPPTMLWRHVGLAATGIVLAVTVVTSVLGFSHTKFLAFDRDRVLTEASGRPGLLLTAGGMHLIQLQTRRPVLLDGGALDSVNYVPAEAPEMVRILNDVYGVDFFHPTGSLGLAHGGALEADTGKELWESRTVADWRDIGATFGVTDVLTPASWSLALPVIAASTEYELYSVQP